MTEGDSKARWRIESLTGAFEAGINTGAIAARTAGKSAAQTALALAQAAYSFGRFDTVLHSLPQTLTELAPVTSTAPPGSDDLARVAASMWALVARAALQTEATTPSPRSAAVHAADLFKRLRDGGHALSPDALSDFATVLFLAGQVDEAAGVMREARAAGTPGSEAHLFAGLIEFARRNFDLAVDALNAAAGVRGERLAAIRLQTLAAALEALGLREQAARAYFELAGIHHLADRHSEALPLLERALALDPSPTSMHIGHADVLRAMGRHDDALAAIDRALQLDPENGWALLVKAQTLNALGRRAEAADVMRAALVQESDNVTWLTTYGDILLGLRHLDEAEATLTRVLELDPDNVMALSRRGEVFRFKNRPKEALEDFDTTLKLRPGHLWTMRRRGDILRVLGRYEDALAQFEEVLKALPDDEWSLASQGEAFRRLGRLKDAEASLRRALEVLPDYRFAMTALGHTLSDQRRDAEAMMLFEEVLKEDPADPWALQGAAYALLRLDRIERGSRLVQQYLEYEPRSAWALAVHGAMLFQVENYAEALARFSRSAELDSGSAWVHNGYAVCAMWAAAGATGTRTEELFAIAHERATHAVSLEPNVSTWKVTLGETMWRGPNPRREEAKQYYEQVMNEVRAKTTIDYYDALDAGWAAFRLAFDAGPEFAMLLAESERYSVEALTQKKDRPASAEAAEAKLNLALAILCSRRSALALSEFANAIEVLGENEKPVRRGLIARARTHLEETIRDWPHAHEVPHTDKALKLLESAYLDAAPEEQAPTESAETATSDVRASR